MEHPQVVKIYATTQAPDYESPWQTQTPSSSTGSGVIIGPRTVLTGAHVVANATFVQIQEAAAPDKLVARRVAVCHDCDLALLTLQEPTAPDLADGFAPAEIGELPDLRDHVSVVGFPVGGEEISVTEGVVSRIEVTRYTHSQRQLLAVTVDAAINEGNSGGPVFKDGRVAGIAFQKLHTAENIGELVPAPLIRHFLDGVERGRSVAMPGLGIRAQNLENPHLRRHLGMPEGVSGVLVNLVEYGSSAWGVLQPGDAMLAIDGQIVANNGTVRYRDQYRTRYDVVLGHHFVGDRVAIDVLRDGRRQTVEIELEPLARLVPRSRYDQLPTYFVFGGLVFQVLSRDYLTTWPEWWKNVPDELLNAYNHGIATAERQELVVLTQVLADALTVGYARFGNKLVDTVNGVVPRDMRHFVSLIESASDRLVITTSTAGTIVLDPVEARGGAEAILRRYHIPADRSADLRP
jgi:S1-C subfamily serine protease